MINNKDGMTKILGIRAEDDILLIIVFSNIRGKG